MQKTNIIALVILAIFIGGAGVIMYYGRPIMNIENTPQQNTTNKQDTEDIEDGGNEDTEEMTEEKTGLESENGKGEESNQAIPQASGTYTSAQVATHAVEADCWASVDENVYDLTSWVSRHPGGSKAIISLCGTDATARFEGKHGGSSAAKAALALLKIGTLSE